MRAQRRSWLQLIAVLVCAASAAHVRAQGNDLAAPSGGRSTLMGGTGVALGRDGAAPFYNPATIVRIKDRRIAFSVNFYNLSFSHFDKWHQPGAVDQEQFGDRNLGGTGLFQSQFRTMPSTLCLFFTVEQLASAIGQQDDEKSAADSPENRDVRSGKNATDKKLAVCFATLESDDVDMQAINFRGNSPSGPLSQVQSLARRWVRSYVGPTYSWQLSDKIALGGSLQLAYTYDSLGVNSSSLTSRAAGGGIATALGTSGSGRSFDLTAVIGATYRLDRITLGASVRLPSLHVLGSYNATFYQSYTGDMDTATTANGEGSFRASPPTRLALGAGFAFDRWTLEVNAAANIPIQSALRADLDVTTDTLGTDGINTETKNQKYRVPSHVVVNPSIGAEYFISPSLSVLGGLSTNLTTISPLSPLQSVGNLIQARANHVSASFGVGSYWSSGELLFGIQLDYGWGQALAVNPYVVPNDWSVVSTQSYSLLLVVSGATSLNSIVRIVKSIASGGAPDPNDKEGKPQNELPNLRNPDALPPEARKTDKEKDAEERAHKAEMEKKEQNEKDEKDEKKK